MLRELEVGRRFEFEDKKTALVLVGFEGFRYPPAGTFKYLGVGEWVCPRLLHEQTGKEIIVPESTLLRHVLILL